MVVFRCQSPSHPIFTAARLLLYKKYGLIMCDPAYIVTLTARTVSVQLSCVLSHKALTIALHAPFHYCWSYFLTIFGNFWISNKHFEESKRYSRSKKLNEVGVFYFSFCAEYQRKCPPGDTERPLQCTCVAGDSHGDSEEPGDHGLLGDVWWAGGRDVELFFLSFLGTFIVAKTKTKTKISLREM